MIPVIMAPNPLIITRYDIPARITAKPMLLMISKSKILILAIMPLVNNE